MSQPSNPFTYTGALRLDHPLFRGRDRELARLEQAALGNLDSFLLIYGGRQNGKTTLLLRLEAQLSARREQGVRVCRIDFQGLPEATPSEAYRHIARAVARVLPQASQTPDLSDDPTLSDFLESALRVDTVKILVLLLDELGVLPDRTRNNLANVLRALHTLRLISPTLAKLRIILAGGIEIYNLAVVEASALRNVCEIVRLDNLSEADALNMVTDGLVSIGMSATDALLFSRAIYQRVCGHPYLTQRLGQLLAAEHLAGSRIPPQGFVETRCWDVLESGNDPLLEHLRRSIDEFELEDAVRRLLSASQRTTRTDEAVERLSLLGLAQRTEGFWTPRNPLFSVALAEWLRLGVPRTGDISSRSVAIRQKAIEQHRDELQAERIALDEEINRATLVNDQRRLRRRMAVIEEEIKDVDAVLAQSKPGTSPGSVKPPKNGTTKAVEAPHLPTANVEPPENSSTEAAETLPTDAALSTTSTTRSTAKPQPPSATATSLPQPTAIPAPPPALIPELVAVPAGPFLMGSSADDPMAYDDERPQHSLTLPDYWIGKTEVTNAQFRPFVEGDGYRKRAYWTAAGWAWKERVGRTKPSYWNDTKWSGDQQPVVGVTWYEAVAYVRWLSAQTDHPFRLPSETEWEKAARGSDGRIWPWGNSWAEGLANTKEASVGRSMPVGSYPTGASPYGALDMAGNVWEWCATLWCKGYPYAVKDEWTMSYLEQEVLRVIRGGSWYNEQKFARGAHRYYSDARNINGTVGMRVASSSPRP